MRKKEMKMAKITQIIPEKLISSGNIKDKIYTIRGVKVMLDMDLAEIYGYSTKRFNEQVKNNIEKFDEDFRFQLTDEEILYLSRLNYLTSMQVKGVKGGRTYNPYAFTEQGIYMLMTVLKGDLAVAQSKSLIRIFKEMKDFIIENRSLLDGTELAKLSMQTAKNTSDIAEIKENMVTKDYLMAVIHDFSELSAIREILILNGTAVEADVAYTKIYQQARQSIYIVDNYINTKTLLLLSHTKKNVQIVVFSDNVNKGLTKTEFSDFTKEYPNVNLTLQKTNGIYHDRYIVLDYNTATEKMYHCGASSKDAGKKINSILKIDECKPYHSIIDDLLKNPLLVL